MLLRGAIIGAVLVLATIAAAALYLRANTVPTQVAYRESSEIPCISPNQWPREHGFLPGCEGMSRAGPYLGEMKFNSFGQRDEEYPPRARAGTLRILLLGASNVLGVGVPAAETIDRLLERELSRKLRRKVEVVNAAVPGYCTWQAAIGLPELLERYHPELVLAYLLPNSCSLNDAVWEGRILWEDGRPFAVDRSILGRDTSIPALNRWAFAEPKRFRVLHTLHEQLRRLYFSWRLKWHENENPAALLLAPSWRALATIDQLSKDAGARFAVFYGKHRNSEEKKFHVFDQFLHAAVEPGLAAALSRYTPKLRLLNDEIYRELSMGPVRTLRLDDFEYFAHQIPENTHLRPEGHRELARSLSQTLTESFPELGSGRR